jgi:hypothetical protein
MDCLTTDVMFHSSFSPLPETMTLLLASIVSHWPGLIVWGLGVCVVGQFAGGNGCVSFAPFPAASSVQARQGQGKHICNCNPPVRDSFTFTSQQRMLTPSLCLR